MGDSLQYGLYGYLKTKGGLDDSSNRIYGRGLHHHQDVQFAHRQKERDEYHHGPVRDYHYSCYSLCDFRLGNK